jgi:hypothetical protein
METLQALTKKACEMFASDVLAPSIVTSWVRDSWYVSIVRWRGTRKEMTRQVLFSVTNDDLEAAFAETLRRLTLLEP